MSRYLDPFLRPWKVVKDAFKGSKDNLKKDDHSSFLGPIGKLTDPLAITLGRDSSYSRLIHEKIPRWANTAAEPFVKAGHYGNPVYWYGKKTGNKTLNDIHDLGQNKGADIAGLVAGSIFGGGALMGGGAGAGSSGGAAAGGLGTGTGGTAFNSAAAWGSFGGELAAPFAGGAGGAAGGAAGGGLGAGLGGSALGSSPAWGSFGGELAAPFASGGGSGAAAGGGAGGGMFSFDWTDPNTYMRLAGNMPQQQQQQQRPDPAAEFARMRAEQEARERERKLAEALRELELAKMGARMNA